MTKLKKCVGKENMQRLNYLYQVSTFQHWNQFFPLI